MSNPIYDLMYRGESGAAGYNAYNRGTYTDAEGRERIRPGNPPMDFSQFSLGELQDLQHLPRRDPDRVFAVGKYQIIPSTMDAAVARLGLERETPFTPELQDRIFTDYLLREKQPAVRDYIMGVPGATLENAQRGLAREWASFGDPDKDGRSYYGGANRAHITLDQSADALDHMRGAYAQATARGLSPDEAWRAATAVDPSQHTSVQGTPPPRRDADPMADGLLRRDERGEAIGTLQQNLATLGYLGRDGRPLSVDGHFGPNTEHAVRAYQQDRGLDVDGIAGPRTLGAISEQMQARTPQPESRSPIDGLLDAARGGADAIREAAERLRNSSIGQQWQQRVDDATVRDAAQGQCAQPERDTAARER